MRVEWPPLVRFVPLMRFEIVVEAPTRLVKERIEASVAAPTVRADDSAPLSGSIAGDRFELRLRDLTANSGRAFLVGAIQDRGTSTAAVGHVCVSTLPVLIFLAVVGLALLLKSGIGVAVAFWGLAILVFGHAKTRSRTLRAMRGLMSGG